ncbi:MAG: hypothetical protein WC205_14805 [Opitutaceae bacterium]|jgi:hypothetical protein
MSTPPTAFFQSLRESQARSADEQRLLSGRDWLLVAALVQFLTVLYPIHRYILSVTFSFHTEKTEHLPALIAGMLALVVVFVLLWWWGRYAPYRATLAALLAFLVFHAAVALFTPQAVLDSIASKILVLAGLVLAVRTGWLRHRPQ